MPFREEATMELFPGIDKNQNFLSRDSLRAVEVEAGDV